ncbi:MAG TPA: carboxylating nicotinate-nucleotide diphosphorylase [Chloroflexota bacterium]|nr:carboxylating nicotinate-nucleotide diphosphorylase [Chloroflexota bacterium]
MAATSREFFLAPEEVRKAVARALAEDLPWGDVTTDNLIPYGQAGVGRLEARQSGILAGLPLALETFAQLDPDLRIETQVSDGTRLAPGQIIALVRGSLRSLLRGERVALNFLQRLSGVATSTDGFVQAVEGTGARIVDTRKTTPGLRLLEKYAVRVGGGQNHRFCLSDAVLIKDNHLAALALRGIDLGSTVRDLRSRIPHTTSIEIEVENFGQLAEALEAGADTILLDNMSPAKLREAVVLVAGRARTEASGGITLETVRAVAESGVDLISVGALTHSVKALDLALEIEV